MRCLCFCVGEGGCAAYWRMWIFASSPRVKLCESISSCGCAFFRSWFTESQLPIKFTLIYVVCRLPQTQALMSAHQHTHSSLPNTPVFLSPSSPPPSACLCLLSVNNIPILYLCLLPDSLFQMWSFHNFSKIVSPFYSNLFPPLSLFYSACVAPIASPLCGLPSVRSLLLIVSCVWPGHFKLNIYRPIYLPPVPRWFKYWHRVSVFSHARSGQGCRRLGEGGAELGQDKTGLEKGKESKV